MEIRERSLFKNSLKDAVLGLFFYLRSMLISSGGGVHPEEQRHGA
jgi:hypothetical protein